MGFTTISMLYRCPRLCHCIREKVTINKDYRESIFRIGRDERTECDLRTMVMIYAPPIQMLGHRNAVVAGKATHTFEVFNVILQLKYTKHQR